MATPAEGSPVRTYVITGGRSYPTQRGLRPETLLVAAPEVRPPRSATPEQRDLLRLCQGLLSVAEASAHLHLPLSAVVVVASDLIDSGHLVVRSFQRHVLPDRAILERVLDGLQRL